MTPGLILLVCGVTSTCAAVVYISARMGLWGLTLLAATSTGAGFWLLVNGA